jgi:hypothetical protein
VDCKARTNVGDARRWSCGGCGRVSCFLDVMDCQSLVAPPCVLQRWRYGSISDIGRYISHPHSFSRQVEGLSYNLFTECHAANERIAAMQQELLALQVWLEDLPRPSNISSACLPFSGAYRLAVVRGIAASTSLTMHSQGTLRHATCAHQSSSSYIILRSSFIICCVLSKCIQAGADSTSSRRCCS